MYNFQTRFLARPLSDKSELQSTVARFLAYGYRPDELCIVCHEQPFASLFEHSSERESLLRKFGRGNVMRQVLENMEYLHSANHVTPISPGMKCYTQYHDPIKMLSSIQRQWEKMGELLSANRFEQAVPRKADDYYALLVVRLRSRDEDVANAFMGDNPAFHVIVS